MRILSLTLVLLILFGCSKDEDTKTKASTSPLVATWQLDDLKIEGEIAGVKFSFTIVLHCPVFITQCWTHADLQASMSFNFLH